MQRNLVQRTTNGIESNRMECNEMSFSFYPFLTTPDYMYMLHDFLLYIVIYIVL